MSITQFFADASNTMTVISFLTFIGIIWWTFSGRRAADFATAAQLPFADEPAAGPTKERHHA
jgi:cytochrome c oxidase cbb3-type subunit 4